MVGSSAAYNLASSAARRGFLHQLDHAAIFLMIVAIYTPFTTCRLHGVWAIGMTAAVWTGAVTGSRHEADLSTSYRARFALGAAVRLRAIEDE
jgi:channel protein (hemolysin III family)